MPVKVASKYSSEQLSKFKGLLYSNEWEFLRMWANIAPNADFEKLCPTLHKVALGQPTRREIDFVLKGPDIIKTEIYRIEAIRRGSDQCNFVLVDIRSIMEKLGKLQDKFTEVVRAVNEISR